MKPLVVMCPDGRKTVIPFPAGYRTADEPSHAERQKDFERFILESTRDVRKQFHRCSAL